jgi:transposase
MADRPVVLVRRKRIRRCPDPDCAVATFSEDTDDIGPRSSLTERARAEICQRVGQDGDSVAQVARKFGVGWHTAMAAVVDHGTPRVNHLSRLGAPSALGLDETSFLAATAQHSTLMVTGFVDLDRHRLIDVVESRTAAAIRAARRGLAEFYQQCTDAQVPERTRLARTIGSWEREILGWHRTGLSNGATEATNLLIKKVKRVGHGFRSFRNYRLRLLLHCGIQWQTGPTAPISGRQPRFVA